MQWKAIQGFEDHYEVSDCGDLRNKRNGRTLTPREHNAGYLSYCLSVKQKCTYILAHRLVAEAFIPNPENKRTVNHKDCNKHNNHADNLEWCTHGENHAYAFSHGRKNPNAFELGINRVTEEDVRYIRSHYKKGDPVFGGCPLSRRFNISVPSLMKIVNHISYKSVV